MPASYSAFFYGTLMVPEILARVCGHKGNWIVKPAILHDYRRHRVAYADYPAIIPTPDASVRGTYVTGLSRSDVAKLDIFEGSQYKRVDVKINVLDVVGDLDGKGNVEGEEVGVQTYVWISGVAYLEDKEWDFAEFQKEKMKRWVGSHEEYEEVDEAVGEGNADPTGGRGVGGDIARRLADAKDEEVFEAAV